MTPPEPAATPSWRKPAGMLLLLLAVLVWAMACITLMDLLGPLPKLVEPLIFIVAGIGWLWVLPMRRLLRWMELR